DPDVPFSGIRFFTPEVRSRGVAPGDAGPGQWPALKERSHLAPAERVCVAPPRQPFLPDPHERLPVPPHPSNVSRHAIVSVVATRHRRQMAVLLGNRPVSVSPTPVAHRSQPPGRDGSWPSLAAPRRALYAICPTHG